MWFTTIIDKKKFLKFCGQNCWFKYFWSCGQYFWVKFFSDPKNSIINTRKFLRYNGQYFDSRNFFFFDIVDIALLFKKLFLNSMDRIIDFKKYFDSTNKIFSLKNVFWIQRKIILISESFCVLKNSILYLS